MATAQTTFTAMVRDGIRPQLRAVGLRGSATTFVLPSETHYALIGLQKARSSDHTEVRFTANVTVGAKRDWEAARRERDWLPAQPAANSRYGAWIWQERIGLLMPGGLDHWWKLQADEDWRPLAAEVVASILTYAVPAMDKRLGP